MCGVFGFSKLSARTKVMAPFLAWEMEERGDDSWGATDGYRIVKNLGPISQTWALPQFKQGIFHTRAASVGNVSLPNQHPFVFDRADGTGRIVGVHNGCISNHTELTKKYNREFLVDSMHVFAHIAEGKPTNEIQGWGALSWFDTSDHAIHFCRFNMQDLHVVRLVSGEIVFCSTRAPLIKAAQFAKTEIAQFYMLDGDQEYYIKRDKTGTDELYQGKKMHFGGRYSGTYNYQQHHVTHIYCSTHKQWKDQCPCPDGKKKENEDSPNRNGVSSSDSLDQGAIYQAFGNPCSKLVESCIRQPHVGSHGEKGLCLRCHTDPTQGVALLCPKCLVQFADQEAILDNCYYG